MMTMGLVRDVVRIKIKDDNVGSKGADDRMGDGMKIVEMGTVKIRVWLEEQTMMMKKWIESNKDKGINDEGQDSNDK